MTTSSSFAFNSLRVKYSWLEINAFGEKWWVGRAVLYYDVFLPQLGIEVLDFRALARFLFCCLRRLWGGVGGEMVLW